jgi:hypothetical protein
MKNTKTTKIIPITVDAEELARDNKNYKEIESFEQYELTTCIAYEMAIRNSIVDDKLKKLELLAEFEDEHQYLELEESDDSLFGLSEDRWKELSEVLSLQSGLFAIELQKMIDKEKSKVFDSELYQEIYCEDALYDRDEIVKKVYKNEKFCVNKTITKISTSAIYHMKDFLEKDLIYTHYIYPKSTVFQIPGSNEPYYFDDEEHSLVNFMNLPNIDENDCGFFYKIQNNNTTSLNLQIVDDNDDYENIYRKSEEPKKFEINTIIQTFKRRMYEPRTSLLALNFSKSLEENIAYLKAMYKHFDNNDKKIIKTPLEYLGNELKIDTINYKNMSASEWADCFFIYDFYNLPHIDSDSIIWDRLKEIFNNYHGVKIKKSSEEKRKDKNKGDNSTYKVVQLETYNYIKENNNKMIQYKSFYSTTTLRDRYKLMKTLIEDEKYKILLLK